MSLNDLTYSQLAVLAGRLSILAKKPISLGMTIAIATNVFGNMLHYSYVEKLVEKAFSELSANMLTPEEFDAHLDEFFKKITGEKKK